MKDASNDVSVSGVASAALVNRTHRVVRERAKSMQQRRLTLRSLWVPLTISAGLLAAAVFAIWSVLDQNMFEQMEPAGLPDASQQIFVLLMWCLPITAAVLAVVLLRGRRSDGGRG